MKNIVLIFLGTGMILYTLAIGSEVFAQGAGKNHIENVLSQVVEHTLEDCYGRASNEDAVQRLMLDLELALGTEVDLQVRSVDMDKGILSVVLTQHYQKFDGTSKEIIYEKTAIVEQEMMHGEQVRVTFMLGEEVYKEYTLTKGEDCPIPILPTDIYVGWEEYGAEGSGPVTQIRQVEEDRVYVAITE